MKRKAVSDFELDATLSSLAERILDAPDWLEARIMAAVSNQLRQMGRLAATVKWAARPQVAVAGTAILAAGIAGAVYASRRRSRSRHSKLRTALAGA